MIHVRSFLVVVVAVSAAAACKGTDPSITPHEVGATSFVSQAPGGSARGGTGGSVNYGAPGPATAGAPQADGSGNVSTPTRTIEEADIYKRDGSLLYVLNTYRGLQILDLADARTPRLVGHVALTGNPVDLYLRNHTAIVAVNDSFAYRVAADGSMQPHRGSRVLAVDVTNPASPVVVSDLAIEGAVEQTRLVGDILYVASHKYGWYDWVPGGSVSVSPGGSVSVGAAPSGGSGVASGSSTGNDTIYVASFDLRDPAHPAQVARIDFPATGWDTHANVTAERITLSFAGYAADASGSYGPTTKFQIVDISDPAGAMTTGASFATRGTVKDRWGMDFDATKGLFRAAVNLGFNVGAAVDIWTSPDRDHVTPLSHVELGIGESLTSARFDGSRIYVVTALRTDPLWAIDATDPAKPVMVGSLHMPGQLDFIEPRADRLIALGHTDEAGQPWQLQVSLLDVTQLSTPLLLQRVLLGTGYGQVAAKPDDLRKAFLVFDPPPAGIGLVLVPYYGWDRTSYQSKSGTQLIDLGRDTLTLSGFVGHPGMVTRAFPIDAAGTRLAALSDTTLQTIDAANRATAAELGRLDLARSVTSLAIVHGKAVELSGDWSTGVMELVVTDALDPDAAVPLARVDLAAPQARMIQDGDVLWTLATEWSSSPPHSWLQAVDVADPAHPVVRGRLDLLSGAESFGYVRSWGYGNDALLVGKSLVIHHAGYPCAGVCAAATSPGPSMPGYGGSSDPAQIRIYDVSDPNSPKLASTVSPTNAAWAYGLQASGSFLWLTHFEWDSQQQNGSYFLDRIDLTDPAKPTLLPKINVPGVFLAASPDGSRIYTIETSWTEAGSKFWLHRLELLGSVARLEASVAVDGYPSGDAVDGGHAWLAVHSNTSSGSARLLTVDLGAMRVTDEQTVDGGWSWLRGAIGGKLFLDAGWNDQGLLVYDLSNPARPAYQQFIRTPSWVSDIVVSDGRAYLPSGPYGVPMVELH